MTVHDAALADRLRGAVWGHLVGDAVGVPYEFQAPSRITTVEFGAKGTHGQPPGTWSDDGALMLATLDSLLTGSFDLDDMGRRYLEWFRGTAHTPDGDGRFDIGRATHDALTRINDGTPPIVAGGRAEADNGNGSLMRILPVALVGRDLARDELVEQARIARAIRHGHDTDTTAAVARGLAGIRSGVSGIPTAWLDAMRGHDLVDPLVERLAGRA